MKPLNKSNVLKVPFIILTGSIVVLCLLTQVLINFSLQDIKNDTQTIKAATSQRILTHQIVNKLAADNLAGILVGPPMDSLAGIFLRNHVAILKGNPAENLQPLEDTFVTGYKIMDTAFRAFYNDVAFIASSDNNNSAFVGLLNKQEIYMRAIDGLIQQIDSFSKNEVSAFQRTEVLIMVSSLLILFVEAIFIFLPAIRKIKKQSQQFKEIAFHQSHIVRQPLSNIKALLGLIDTQPLTLIIKNL
jgi:hypothetical protein